ncbi:MAG: hypothetical protein GYB67_04745 [Chloroflexi bacterium]|nr:hypothetical protein [Chloroflexota bacterium]
MPETHQIAKKTLEIIPLVMRAPNYPVASGHLPVLADIHVQVGGLTVLRDVFAAAMERDPVLSEVDS